MLQRDSSSAATPARGSAAGTPGPKCDIEAIQWERGADR